MPELPEVEAIRRSLDRRLHRAIVGVLRDAVQSAVRGYQRPAGFHSQERFEPRVYGREGQPCRKCGNLIRRSVLRGRSTFYCPQCQADEIFASRL